MKVESLTSAIAYTAALAAAATQTTEVSESAALFAAIGAGLIGGLTAGTFTAQPGAVITAREYLGRMLVCGAGTPGLVWFLWLQHQDALHLYPVAAVTGILGILSWPLVSLARAVILKIKPGDIARRLFGLPPESGQ